MPINARFNVWISFFIDDIIVINDRSVFDQPKQGLIPSFYRQAD